MILLIDAGNTRVKWGLVEGDRWVADGALAHADVADLGPLAANHLSITRVVGANVAGAQMAEAIGTALAQVGAAPEWQLPTELRCGVHNGYEHPGQLGADRWAALIGARALHPGACLVVNAGTATTVDVLDANGHFRGGLILPGEHLMRRSLAGNTAQLPFATGHFRATPRNTADAIVTGCLHAQAGAIERMFRLIADDPAATCLLSGGGADAIAGLLAIAHRRVDNLVLKGLAVMAGFPGRP